MKILIVSSYFGKTITGALIFLKYLSSELIQRGHKVIILLDERYRNSYDVKGAELKWFKSFHLTAYSPSTSFIGILQKTDVDVVHLNGYMSFQTDFGAVISSIRKIPVVLTPHGSLLGYKHLAKSIFERTPYILHEILTLKRSTKIAKFVVVTSDAEYRDAINFGIKPEKLQLIPLGFNNPLSIPKKSKDHRNKKLLFVGRIVPNKNLETIFLSLQQILKKFPDVELTVVGDEIKGKLIGDTGYKEKIIELMKTLKIDKNIEFVGWKTQEELWKIYSNSDIMVSTSSYENFSMPILEAASFGIPIISTNVGVANEIICGDKGGKIISQNHNEMTESIIKLLKDNEIYLKASEFVRQRSEDFKISTIAQKYENIFQKAITLGG